MQAQKSVYIYKIFLYMSSGIIFLKLSVKGNGIIMLLILYNVFSSTHDVLCIRNSDSISRRYHGARRAELLRRYAIQGIAANQNEYMYEIQKITDHCSGKEKGKQRAAGQETSRNTPFRDDIKASGVNESTYAERSRVIFHKRAVTPKTARHFKGARERLVRFARNNRGQKYPVPVPTPAPRRHALMPAIRATTPRVSSPRFRMATPLGAIYAPELQWISGGAFKHARDTSVSWALRRSARGKPPCYTTDTSWVCGDDTGGYDKYTHTPALSRYASKTVWSFADSCPPYNCIAVIVVVDIA